LHADVAMGSRVLRRSFALAPCKFGCPAADFSDRTGSIPATAVKTGGDLSPDARTAASGILQAIRTPTMAHFRVGWQSGS
jgi:hypothetical protein